MTRTTTPRSKAKPAATREDRLKAALKANMARRKAQAKARASAGDGQDEDKG